MKTPKDGWVHELADVKSAAKTSLSAGAQLRLATAAYKLRMFQKLETADNLGLALTKKAIARRRCSKSTLKRARME
jgi:hypothetical protein